MVAHRWVGRSIAGLAAASLLIGCTSSAAAPTVAPAVTPTPARTATVPETAVTYGPVAVITGEESCDIDFGTITGEGTTVQHSRNGMDKCTDTVNDPRVNGIYTATWNLDYWGTPDHLNGALVQWGTARIDNAGGAWEGRATGVYSSDRGDTIVWWWTGTGGYAGLTYFELVTGSGPWTIHGQIFPGSPPTP